MENSSCDICGELLEIKYFHTLKNCNHTYHYECIMKTFMYDKKRKNQCPLCRTENGLLPIVNGLSKLTKGIHYNDVTVNLPNYESISCNAILQSGKRKGQECGSKCMLGLSVCKRHHVSTIKKKHKKKKNGLGDDLEQVQVEQLIESTSITA